MRYFIFSFFIFISYVSNLPTCTAQDSLETDTELYNLNEPSPKWSNTKRRRFRAYVSAKELNNGALIVILKTNTKRLKELEIISRKPELSITQKAVIKEKIDRTKSKTKQMNENLIDGFLLSYSFSKVYFIYDTNLTEFLDGSTKGIFVNPKGKIDKTIELEEKDFYICNYILVSSSNDTEGLVIFDSKMNRVKSPFPGVAVAGSSGVNALLQLLINDKKYQKKAILRDIEKLAKSLNTFLIRGNKEFKQP